MSFHCDGELPWRVRFYGIDLPELKSIQLGHNTCGFSEREDSELVMCSNPSTTELTRRFAQTGNAHDNGWRQQLLLLSSQHSSRKWEDWHGVRPRHAESHDCWAAALLCRRSPTHLSPSSSQLHVTRRDWAVERASSPAGSPSERKRSQHDWLQCTAHNHSANRCGLQRRLWSVLHCTGFESVFLVAGTCCWRLQSFNRRRSETGGSASTGHGDHWKWLLFQA